MVGKINFGVAVIIKKSMDKAVYKVNIMEAMCLLNVCISVKRVEKKSYRPDLYGETIIFDSEKDGKRLSIIHK